MTIHPHLKTTGTRPHTFSRATADQPQGSGDKVELRGPEDNPGPGIYGGLVRLGRKFRGHEGGVKPPSDSESISMAAPVVGFALLCAAALLSGGHKDK